VHLISHAWARVIIPCVTWQEDLTWWFAHRKKLARDGWKMTCMLLFYFVTKQRTHAKLASLITTTAATRSSFALSTLRTGKYKLTQ